MPTRVRSADRGYLQLSNWRDEPRLGAGTHREEYAGCLGIGGFQADSGTTRKLAASIPDVIRPASTIFEKSSVKGDKTGHFSLR